MQTSIKVAQVVALHTIPVVVKKGRRQLVINAMLDDCSTKSYINSVVASQLGLQGKVCSVTVTVLNGQESAFQTLPVEAEQFGLEDRC